jgi:hypothetical protein
MATPPTLFWYQLDVGTYGPAYLGQLDATVRELCAENGVLPPQAVWWSGASSGTYVDGWWSEIDRCVRELCVILNVPPPVPRPGDFFSGVGPRIST